MDRKKARASIAPLRLPLGIAGALPLFLLIPAAWAQVGIRYSFLLAALAIILWSCWLGLECVRGRKQIQVSFRAVLPHWMQTLAQGSLILWWGLSAPMVGRWMPMVAAQLLLAVALECLYALHRRGHYTLGFGPIPVVFSVNLFLWFTESYFFAQFLMIALVYTGKEFVRWQLGGKSRHIFNPSALALFIAAVVLILTGGTGVTMGIEIAQSQFLPPAMFFVIFLVSLPAQLIFGTAMMTLPAVLTLLGLSLVYEQAAGIFFFYDAYVPVSVFLGLHLLFTDPATSPRSDGGRVLFGVLYGCLVFLCAYVLELFGAPTFYDKLLPVPLLNLLAPRLDALAGALRQRGAPGFAKLQRPGGSKRRLVTVGSWGAIFAGLSLGGMVGDNHPGQYYPYWNKACEKGNARACDYSGVMLQNFCDLGSGWACNEFGVLLVRLDQDYGGAAREFEIACRQSHAAGCANLQRLAAGDRELLRLGAEGFARDRPPDSDLSILVRGSKGPPNETSPEALKQLACARGWVEPAWGCSG